MNLYHSARSHFRALVVLGLLVALLVPARMHAAAPPPARVPVVEPVRGPGPLFDAEALHINPLDFSVGLLGSIRTPSTGPLSMMAGLYAGEKLRVWSLEGALTNRYTRTYLGASTLWLAGASDLQGPAALTRLATLKFGNDLDCWTLIDTDKVRGLPRDWMRVIEDGRGFYAGNVEGEMYSRVLVRAYYTSAASLARVSRRDITFIHLMEDPERYRGSIIHLQGRLLQINRFDPPFEAREAGITDIYEAWVTSGMIGTSPYVVLTTVWPEGLAKNLLGQNLIEQQIPLEVAVDGYFFKRYRYSAKGGKERDTPLLIGRTLVSLQPMPAKEQPRWVGNLMYLFMFMLVALIVMVVSLTVWFRRNDDGIRRRILARMPEFALPPPDVPPAEPPQAMPVKRPPGASHTHPPRIIFPSRFGDRGSDPGNDPRGGTEDQPGEDAGA